VRLGYRVSYDRNTDSLEHVVFFPVRSNPTMAQYARVPTAVRRALPVVVLNAQRPLQLRAEGVLRRLVTERDADRASAAFRALEQGVAAAANGLAADATIAATIDAVLQAGGLAQHLADTPPTAATVRFRPDDGSLSALLRAIQPALELDEAGLLTLSNHGSTAAALLTSAEALLLAASVDGALVLGDDFGDGLDAATAEHLAAVLRAQSAQVWLTTRRPEVARAFAPGELVRLVRDGRARTHHLVPQPADKKEVAVRRLLHAQLLPALTAPVVAITEGPHDLTSYSSADRHRAAAALPLAAAGVRLISADNGSGGGTGQIPRVAELAHAMGFRVIALIDSDPAKTSAAELADIDAACDAVVRLPASTGIELALLTGVDVAVLRAAAAVLPAYGMPDPTSGVTNADVPKAIAKLLHKKGLHEQFLDAIVDELGSVPPVLDAALTAVATVADVTYAGPRRIDLAAPAPPAAASAP
jgi:putative ATP-dependent endonuclease of the OLD family